MELFRIARPPYHRDLSGRGAQLVGGRWNNIGVAVVYLASSRALAALEVLAHTPLKYLGQTDLRIITLETSLEGMISAISDNDLPPKWYEPVPDPYLAKMGDDFVAELSTPLLRVPSALMPWEYNYLLNPAHPKAKEMKIIDEQRWKPDPRLAT